ncbi:hypothetical protein BGW38_003456, partial [Lunasporangiospora selenospora]
MTTCLRTHSQAATRLFRTLRQNTASRTANLSSKSSVRASYPAISSLRSLSTGTKPGVHTKSNSTCITQHGGTLYRPDNRLHQHLYRSSLFSTTSTKEATHDIVFNTPLLNKMKPKLVNMKNLHDKLLKEINGQSSEFSVEDLSPAKFAEMTKQIHDLSLITEKHSELESLHLDIQSLQQMMDDPLTAQDKDLLEMTKEELAQTKESINEMEQQLLLAMLPKDTVDEANAILEIRAGTGGDEAGLFAADVLRMYERFAERQHWKWDPITMNHDGLGSIKDVTVSISGFNVFGQLKFESGVHRVQRVPATETQGRIHTSTITVAIMPQPTEVQIQINDSDVRVDVFRASGSGGQKVNTTDSAIRLTHLPTGLVVAIQDERSNQKNRAKAFTILRARLFELEREKLATERRDARRKQVGA